MPLIFNVFNGPSLLLLYFSPVRLEACVLNETTSNGMPPENGTSGKMHPGVSKKNQNIKINLCFTSLISIAITPMAVPIWSSQAQAGVFPRCTS